MNDNLEHYIIQNATIEDIESGGRFSIMNNQYVWFVESGTVDLFLDDKAISHIGRISSGGLFVGLSQTLAPPHTTLIGRVCSHTTVMKIEKNHFTELSNTLKDAFEKKINLFLQNLSKDNIKNMPPKNVVDLFFETQYLFQTGTVFSNSRAVKWVYPQNADLYFINDSGFVFPKNKYYAPVTIDNWYETCDDFQSPIYDTHELNYDDLFWCSIEFYLSCIARLKLIHIQNEKLFLNISLFNKVDSNIASIENALSILNKSYYGTEDKWINFDIKHDPTFVIASYVAQYLEFDIKPIPENQKEFHPIKKFKNILNHSKVFYRKIHLEQDWHRYNHGPIVAFHKKSHIPVAFIPNRFGEYELYEATSSTPKKLTPDYFNHLLSTGYSVSKKIEKEKISLFTIIQFPIKKSLRHIAVTIAAMLMIAALSLLPAILTQYIFENVVIIDDKSQLLQIFFILSSIAFSVFGFELIKERLIVNLENQLDFSVQGVFWDRLLRLPVNFFKQYTAGELTSRIGNLNEIRTLCSNSFFQIILDVFYVMFNFFLLFYYNASVAWVILILLFLAITVFSLLFIKRVRLELLLTDANAKMYGLLSEFFSAISKIRLSGSEYRVFLKWSKTFSHMQHCRVQSQKQLVFSKIITESLPIFLMFILYLSIALYATSLPFTTSVFLAFSIVIGQIAVALYQLLEALNHLLPIVPLFKKSRIFIDAKPEVAHDKIDPGELKGAIEISNVSFKYPSTSNAVLNKVSFVISPGEYVALVGRTGVGKSTLLRLLIGFNKPDSGRIYYDSKDLSTLDTNLLRQQLGIVLQHDPLIPGTIFNNIAGVATLTIKQAWEIVEKVGLADDILRMPMQMNTMITLNGQGLSGGQKQRILIARAIARNPKILILDEATRSLDNLSQKAVIDCLIKLKMTRIVIAHRLSTLVKVDKIFAIDNGEIVETGSYKELLAKKGFFYTLVQKQVL